MQYRKMPCSADCGYQKHGFCLLEWSDENFSKDNCFYKHLFFNQQKLQMLHGRLLHQSPGCRDSQQSDFYNYDMGSHIL